MDKRSINRDGETGPIAPRSNPPLEGKSETALEMLRALFLFHITLVLSLQLLLGAAVYLILFFFSRDCLLNLLLNIFRWIFLRW